MPAAKQAVPATTKVAAAMMCAEPDVAQPSRARSASFASAVSDLKVGGDPAAKVATVERGLTIEEAIASKPELSERLRNSVMSSVTQAKRKLGGKAEFSVEIIDITSKSGVYLIALVFRNA